MPGTSNGVEYILPVGLTEKLGFAKLPEIEARFATKESLNNYALKSEIESGGTGGNLSEYLRVSDFNEKLDSALYTIDITSKLDFNVVSNRITLPPIPTREQVEQMVTTAISNIQVPQPDLTSYFTKDQTVAKVEEILLTKTYVTETRLSQALSELPSGGIDKEAFTNELKSTFVETVVYTPAIEEINTSLAEKATKTFVSEEITRRAAELSGGSFTLDGYAKETFVTEKLQDYTKTAELTPVIEAVVNPKLTDFATTEYVDGKVAAISIPETDNFVLKTELTESVNNIVDPKLTNLATEEFVTTKIGEIPSLDTDDFQLKSTLSADITPIVNPLIENNLTNYVKTETLNATVEQIDTKVSIGQVRKLFKMFGNHELPVTAKEYAVRPLSKELKVTIKLTNDVTSDKTVLRNLLVKSGDKTYKLTNATEEAANKFKVLLKDVDTLGEFNATTVEAIPDEIDPNDIQLIVEATGFKEEGGHKVYGCFDTAVNVAEANAKVFQGEANATIVITGVIPNGLKEFSFVTAKDNPGEGYSTKVEVSVTYDNIKLTDDKVFDSLLDDIEQAKGTFNVELLELN